MPMPQVEVRSQLVPYPLVGVISPWNAPMMLALLVAIGLVLNWLEDEGAAAPRRQIAWAFAVGTLAQLTMVFGLAARHEAGKIISGKTADVLS